MSEAALLSLAECEKVIRKLHNNDDDDDVVKIVNYHISQFSEGGYPGFLGDYYRLVVKYYHGDDESELSNELKEMSFFVKSLPTCNEKKRAMLSESGLFRKEAMIFRHIIPKLVKYSSQKWAPSCYYTRDDLIVMENLELTSFRTLPRHIDPTINHTKMALRCLASFQAANIIYEHLELRPRGMTIASAHESMLFETSWMRESPWCMTGMRALKAVALERTRYGRGSAYEKTIESEFLARVEKVFEILTTPMPKIPSVICHRDLWRNNLMYRHESDDDFNAPPLDCRMIDFQIARYSPLALDVIICILLPSTQPPSTAYIEECLKFHYGQLLQELMRHDVKIENIMSFHDFESACEHFRLMPLVMQPMFFSLCHLPASYIVNLLENNEEEYMRISLHHRDDVVLEFMAKDEFYCRTMTDAVERLIEYLFKIPC